VGIQDETIKPSRRENVEEFATISAMRLLTNFDTQI